LRVHKFLRKKKSIYEEFSCGWKSSGKEYFVEVFHSSQWKIVEERGTDVGHWKI